MVNTVIKVKAPGRDSVEILGPTFEKGKPEGENQGKWSQKLDARNEILKYLQTGQRYFYSQDWFGSERRKNPA
jgi:hypothetical protein